MFGGLLPVSKVDNSRDCVPLTFHSLLSYISSEQAARVTPQGTSTLQNKPTLFLFRPSCHFPFLILIDEAWAQIHRTASHKVRFISRRFILFFPMSILDTFSTRVSPLLQAWAWWRRDTRETRSSEARWSDTSWAPLRSAFSSDTPWAASSTTLSGNLLPSWFYPSAYSPTRVGRYKQQVQYCNWSNHLIAIRL